VLDLEIADSTCRPYCVIPIIAGEAVNVASVPQRSPFRYPGGKTWLVPQVRRWLSLQEKKPELLLEPFAGGGIVSLTAVCEGLVDRAVMVELDEDIANVWKVILASGPQLARRIVEFSMTADNVTRLFSGEPENDRERAFRTVVRNRVSRGGILAPGAGVVKNGENGKGLLSRWYPATLSRRIHEIHSMRDRLSIVQGDGFALLSEHSADTRCAHFIDPPYVLAGRRLYTHSTVNHEALFRVASQLQGDYLLTYDDHHSVRELATRYKLPTVCVPMKSTHHITKFELLIGPSVNRLQC
jgi:DNA adenine methylase